MGPKALLFMAAIAAAAAQDDDKVGGVVIQEFAQRLNHSINATSEATFNQKYQLDTRFFKPGGPIFFIQSAETGMQSINVSDFVDYAPKLGGMVAVLEHRFFSSNSSGDTGHSADVVKRNDSSSSNRTYPDLTFLNVLQDGANFVDWIRSTVQGANESKAIYGGSSSYGGFLAVAARIRHPNTFWGAIASSPALNSFGPLDSNRFRFDAAERNDVIYENISANAYDRIKSSMLALQHCISGKEIRGGRETWPPPAAADNHHHQDNNCDEAIPDLDICSGSEGGVNYTTLYNAAVQTYTFTPQFNYPYVDRYPTAYPFQDLVGKTLAANTTGQVLRVPLLAASWAASPTSCIDASSANITDPGAVAGTVPMYAYVRCAYYPLNTISIPADNMLPEAHARGVVDDLCGGGDDDGAGAAAALPPDYYSANEYFVQKFAVTNSAIDSVDRVLIVQGATDRIAAVGSPGLTVTADLNHSRVVLAEGLAHAEDAVSEAVVPRGAKVELDRIRDVKLEHIKEWLGQGTQQISESTTVIHGLPSLVAFIACGLLAFVFL
ncbi:serine carboxypeptidase S28-domain-containing protein [Biscogniauxia mediterranea]|nr:serine carboxypeptidase S28-domain-containing protein [Biscogniauxia mediterranea]